jgi:hypothetical protein
LFTNVSARAGAEPEPSPTPAAIEIPPARTADIFSIFEKPAAPQREGTMDCSFDYEPSGSTWNPGLREEAVFLASLQAGDMRLGIGKGGQIYSLRGPFGESVPPQRAAAPWIDEVWHVVATSEPLVAPVHEFQNAGDPKKWASAMPIQFFIHQAGIYLKGLTGTEETGAPVEPFYSPLLRSRWDKASRTLHLANWAQQARSPNVWKSGLLVQTAYRDLGDGAIEVSQVLSNFGDQELTYLNAPWGGVRRSALPHTILSEPGGGWKKVEGRWGWSGIPSAPFDETGGWIGWTVDSAQDSSPALAMVFGREQGPIPAWRRARSKILYGTAGEKDGRDYEAVETSCSVDIKPGDSLLVRWYLVAGSFEKVRARAAELAPFATIEKPEFEPGAAQPLWIRDGAPTATGEGEPALHLHAQPVPGTLPVFSMRDAATGKTFATLDLYNGTRRSPLTNPLPETHPEHSRYTDRVVYHTYESGGPIELLGFAHPAPPSQGTSREITLTNSEGGELKLWGPMAPALKTKR